MEIFLIRHAKTGGNLQRRYIGRTDEPLCPMGIGDAQSAGPFPSVSRVVVSPMLRARQTASLLFPHARQEAVEDLREMDFGVFEGRAADEMASDPAYRAWVDGGCKDICPQGEGLAGFGERVCAAFDQAVRQAISQGEDRLILVVHGGTIMAIMDRYAMPRREYWEWHAAPCRGWYAHLDAAMWEACPQLTDCGRMEVISL